MDTIPVLNPVKWREVARAVGTGRVRPVWGRLLEQRKEAQKQPIRFLILRKGKKMVKPAKQELAKMPAEWQERFKRGLKAGVAKARGGKMPTEWIEAWKRGVEQMQPMTMPEEWKQALKRGVAAAAGRKRVAMPTEWIEAWKRGVEQMQPMTMPLEWRERWAAGLLQRGPTSPLAQQYEPVWRAGVERYAATGQPIAMGALAGLREMFTTEGITDLIGVTGGIAAGSVAPGYLLRLLKLQPSTLNETLAGVGVAAIGSAALGLTGQYRMSRLFLFSTVGALLARLLLERLLPTPTAGVGQVKEAVEEMVKKELEKALKEEGLGVITTEEVPIEGNVGNVGLVTTEAVELGAAPIDVEPF